MLVPSRHTRRNAGLSGLVTILVTFLSFGLSGAAMAAEGGKVCSPYLDVDLVSPLPVFAGETIRMNVELGNSGISGGTHMEIDGFGYALDCMPGQSFATCTTAGHLISYQGGITTDCPTESGGTAVLAPPEVSIAITAIGEPIYLTSGQTCNVQFDVWIEDFEFEAGPYLRQSAGWPVTVGPREYGAVCYDESGPFGATTHSSNIGIPVAQCGVDIEKQVSLDDGDSWFDANSSETAAQQVLGGDAIYQAVITNTGTIDYESDITITDPVLGSVVTIAGPASNASIEVPLPVLNSEYEEGMCQSEGMVQNIATVEAVCRGTPTTLFSETSASNSAFLNCVGNPSITIDKTTAPADGAYSDGPVILVGQGVFWKYVVTNNGDLPLVNVDVSDDQGVTVSCPKATLAVGEAMTCTASGFAVSGAYSNIGTATGETENAVPVDDSDASSYFGASPSIGIVKSAAPMTYDAAEDEINYSFVVTNTGNVLLTGVGVSDTKAGSVSCGPWPGTSGELEPGQSVPCAADAAYVVSQAEVDFGSILNLATATGLPPVGPPVQDTDDETVTAIQTPAIDIVKSASPTTYSVLGEDILYTFVVTNTGNVTLTSVDVSDAMVGPVSCDASVLAPAESTNCAADSVYDITQLDLDTGFVTNTATASGIPPKGPPPVTDTDDETITAVQTPAIDIVKTATPTIYSAVGDDITYTFVVTNVGNVTLTNVFVTDDKVGGVTCAPWPGAPGVLLPGQSVPCAGDSVYDITQDDLDAGFVKNTATATGTDPDDDPVTDTDSETVTAEGRAAIEIVKTASPMTYSVLGEDITYTFVVTNIGNVTLTGVFVSDPLAGPVSCDPGVGGAGILAPAESVNCAAVSPYDITQDDLNAGFVTNTATATGTPPEGPDVTDDDSETITVTGEPAISIVKTVSPTTFAALDEILVYTFVVTNTGTIDLDFSSYSQAIEDLNLPDDSAISCDWPGAPLYLAVSEFVSCDIEYMVTQADLDAGIIENVATTRARGVQQNREVDASDDATARSTASPAITLLKEISVDDGVTWKDANDANTAPTVVWPHGADYQITITNTGPLTLTGVTLTDAELEIFAVPLADLAPGASHVLTSGEIEELSVETRCDMSGEFSNSATGAAVTLTGVPIQATDTAVMICVGEPDITILKEVRPVPWPEGAPNDGWSETTTVPVDAPSDAEYRITVTNTGTVDLFDVVVTDNDLPVAVNHYIGDLPRQASVVLYWSELCGDDPADYNLCELYVPNRCEGPGDPMNTASVEGWSVEIDNDGGRVSDSDTATLLCVGEPLIELQKEISLDGIEWFDADDEANALIAQLPLLGGVDVLYRLLVTNVGPVDLYDVTVTDGTLGLTGVNAILIGVLPAGAEVTIDSGIVSELSQPDRCTNAGTFANTASATGFSIDTDTEASDSDAAYLVCTGDPDILLNKEVGVCIALYDDDDSSSDDDGDKGRGKDKAVDGDVVEDVVEAECYVTKADGSLVGGVISWYEVTPAMQPPQDAWYRITVSNIGTSDLENVVISDQDLGLINYWIGDLAVGEEVVLDVDHPEVGYMMFWPGRCTSMGEFDNLAETEGNSVEAPYESVFSSDIATLVCNDAEICVDGDKPKTLTVEYDADSDTNHGQGDSKHVIIQPANAVFPAGPVTIDVYGKKSEPLGTYYGVMPGDQLRISLHRQNELRFDIFDGDTLLQKVKFHVSCSLPLNAGDEFGAITVKY